MSPIDLKVGSREIKSLEEFTAFSLEKFSIDDPYWAIIPVRLLELIDWSVAVKWGLLVFSNVCDLTYTTEEQKQRRSPNSTNLVIFREWFGDRNITEQQWRTQSDSIWYVDVSCPVRGALSLLFRAQAHHVSGSRNGAVDLGHAVARLAIESEETKGFWRDMRVFELAMQEFLNLYNETREN
ncbi:MAG: hypothetical protein P1V97_17515 [Planctomycetota bacterium]|nr:hypothetical protein [Planctomycetota bacterium]